MYMLRRAGKILLVLIAALLILFGISSLVRGPGNRVLERRVRNIVAALAGNGIDSDEITRHDGLGFPVWAIGGTGNVVVRRAVAGYQSVMDIFFLLDEDYNLQRFAVFSSAEGPRVERALAQGDPDALAGATITADAIRSAAAAVRLELLTHGEEIQ